MNKSYKLILVSATEAEIDPAIRHLNQHAETISFSQFNYRNLQIVPLVSGIGSTMMAFSLARFKGLQDFNLIVHAGISGSYQQHIPVGSLVEVVSEQWGDLGAETIDGEFIDGFELNLMDSNRFPYLQTRLLKTRQVPNPNLPTAKGLTVNRTSGSQKNIEFLKTKYNCDVESMEGAGLFYAAKIMDIPFVSIRCISNFVEPRDKLKWKIPEAIENLNKFIISYFDTLEI